MPTERIALRVGCVEAKVRVGGRRLSSVVAKTGVVAYPESAGLMPTEVFASAESDGSTATYPFASAESGGLSPTTVGINPADSRLTATEVFINPTDSGMAATLVGACSESMFMTTGLGLRHFDASATLSTYVGAHRELTGMACVLAAVSANPSAAQRRCSLQLGRIGLVGAVEWHAFTSSKGALFVPMPRPSR